MKIYHVLFTLFAIVFLQTSCSKEVIQSDDELIQISYTQTTGNCGQFKTHSPGGWGAVPQGNNPGTYLVANFANVFNPVTIGCSEGFSISLTSAESITVLLPTGGTPSVLSESSIDPTEMKNTLVGHLVSLTLSVGFDFYDATFAEAAMNLGDMIIATGTFQGVSVNDFLKIANEVIGGCNTMYSIEDIHVTTAQINRNYLNGTIDNGVLKCPETTPR